MRDQVGMCAAHHSYMRVLLLLWVVVSMSACGRCYQVPAWKGEVHVTPLERAAIKKCGTGALTMEGTERITREPYLQSTTTTSTTIVWGSKDARGDVVVTEPGGTTFQRVPAVYAGSPEKRARRRVAQAGDRVAAEDMYIVAATPAQLRPAHLYCYQIVVDGVPLTEPAPMNTASAPGGEQPVQFVVVGDIGTGGPAEEAIKKRMTESPFELLLVLGDIAYSSGKPEQLNGNFFAVYKDVLRYVPVFPAIGNHELITEKGAPYIDAFVLPGRERYYSFDWGDIHFVAIDTNHRTSMQLAWLDQDLRTNTLPWVIVFGHHPPYTNSFRGPQVGVRKAFARIITENKVDLWLSGHEHQYERFRIADVNYVVSGGGGAQLMRFLGKTQSLKQATVHHYLAFEVTATTLTMRAIDIDGREIETVQLSKQPGDVKVKTDGHPDIRETPILPERDIEPDEKLHDGPDDDKHKNHVPSPTEGTTPIPISASR